jgi:hypothetical protein
MRSKRQLLALTMAAGLLVARGALADPDDDFAPHQKVQPAETDVDDDSDDSRESSVDDDSDKSREANVDDDSDDSRESRVYDDSEKSR